jgi:uncharacterized protein YciI
MNYFALMYDVVEGFSEKRMAYRPAHLELINAAHARGELMLAGALGNPPDGALLVFRAENADTAESFARAISHATSGLVKSWRVRPWNVVIGASTP